MTSDKSLCSIHVGGALFPPIANSYDTGAIGSSVAEVDGAHFCVRVIDGGESVIYAYHAALRIYAIGLSGVIPHCLPGVAISQELGVSNHAH